MLHYPVLISFLNREDLDKETKKLINNNFHIIDETFNSSVPQIIFLVFAFSKLIKFLESNNTPFYLSHYLIQQSHFYTN